MRRHVIDLSKLDELDYVDSKVVDVDTYIAEASEDYIYVYYRYCMHQVNKDALKLLAINKLFGLGLRFSLDDVLIPVRDADVDVKRDKIYTFYCPVGFIDRNTLIVIELESMSTRLKKVNVPDCNYNFDMWERYKLKINLLEDDLDYFCLDGKLYNYDGDGKLLSNVPGALEYTIYGIDGIKDLRAIHGRLGVDDLTIKDKDFLKLNIKQAAWLEVYGCRKVILDNLSHGVQISVNNCDDLRVNRISDKTSITLGSGVKRAVLNINDSIYLNGISVYVGCKLKNVGFTSIKSGLYVYMLNAIQDDDDLEYKKLLEGKGVIFK